MGRFFFCSVYIDSHLKPVVAFLFDLPEISFRMKITGFGKRIWKRLTTMGTKKVTTFCFTTFIFRRNTKEI